MMFFRVFLLMVIAVGISVFFYFDLGAYVSLEALKAQHFVIEDYYSQHPYLVMIIYTLAYIAMTGLSLPGAVILTLAGGAIFGTLWGTVIVSFASSIGATLAFLSARFLFRASVQHQFGDSLKTVNAGLAKEGGFYLFTLRLVPVVPFFMINLLMGLSRMKVGVFYTVSQLGMFAGTLVYVNAGTQLGKIHSVTDILSPSLMGSFVLLGVFPILAKKLVFMIRGKAHD